MTSSSTEARRDVASRDLRYRINDDDPAERKRFIRQTFDGITPTYDLLNRILSFGVDRLWRRSAVAKMGPLGGRKALDVCAGTGDLSLALRKRGAWVAALDFSLPMLTKGMSDGRTAVPVAADASALPFRDGSFSALAVAFGIRNIPDLNVFLGETARVLGPGGDFVVLELTRPEGVITRALYRLYLFGIIPLIGGIVSRRRVAYRYLSETIASFVDPRELATMIERAGFEGVAISRKSFGAATIIHCRRKS